MMPAEMNDIDLIELFFSQRFNISRPAKLASLCAEVRRRAGGHPKLMEFVEETEVRVLYGVRGEKFNPKNHFDEINKYRTVKFDPEDEAWRP